MRFVASSKNDADNRNYGDVDMLNFDGYFLQFIKVWLLTITDLLLRLVAYQGALCKGELV